MAELLKRKYEIVVLKVELLQERQDAVRFTLQFQESGALMGASPWVFPLSAIAPPELVEPRAARGSGLDVRLPAVLLAALDDFFDPSDPAPLWVHLVKPYGLLRLVPWERALGEPLERSILMLPDFIFPPPREAMDVLDVALCGSAPLEHASWESVGTAMHQAVDRILASAARSRRVRVHVFVDRVLRDRLLQTWRADDRLDAQIFVYDPMHETMSVGPLDDAPRESHDGLRSPWLRWMRAVLRERPVDVAHFVCHGHLTRESGALLFAASPVEPASGFAAPVGAAELNVFFTQLGIWSTAFSVVQDNRSEAGLRWLADELAQSRPGPLLMHTLREDPAALALRDGYGFLFSVAPHPPPRSTSLFLYGQPYLVQATARPSVRGARLAHTKSGSLHFGKPMRPEPVEADVALSASEFSFSATQLRNDVHRHTVERSLDESPLSAFFDSEPALSAVVASTERFAEQLQLRCQHQARDEVVPTGEAGDRDIGIVFDTLDKLRRVVAEVARRPSTPREDEV